MLTREPRKPSAHSPCCALLHDAVASRADALLLALMIEEYGAPQTFVEFSVQHAANIFLDMIETLETFDFTQNVGGAEVTLQPQMLRRRCDQPAEQQFLL